VRNINAVAARGLPDGFVRQRLDWPTVEREMHRFGLSCHILSLITHHVTSFGKYLITQRSGFGAAWPRPQMEASIMTLDKSSSSSPSHVLDCIRPAALSVPTRHGVHWPQDSWAKNRMAFCARSRALSCCENTIIAAEPMKQPYG